jgi:hypothetical protein
MQAVPTSELLNLGGANFGGVIDVSLGDLWS